MKNHCRTYFPQDYTGTQVFNRRKSSIRVGFEERHFLEFIKLEKLVFERDAELLKNDAYLAETASAMSGQVESDWHGQMLTKGLGRPNVRIQ